jgi:hypothetical protein
MFKRWYHLIFHKHQCFKCTLNDRLNTLTENRGDIIESGNVYLGNNWWLRSKY